MVVLLANFLVNERELTSTISLTNVGNLLATPDGKLAFIDYGMMADVSEEDRYGLIGLVIGLQNKDLPLITENLLKVREILEWHMVILMRTARDSIVNGPLSSAFLVILRSSTYLSLDFVKRCGMQPVEQERHPMSTLGSFKPSWTRLAERMY